MISFPSSSFFFFPERAARQGGSQPRTWFTRESRHVFVISRVASSCNRSSKVCYGDFFFPLSLSVDRTEALKVKTLQHFRKHNITENTELSVS